MGKKNHLINSLNEIARRKQAENIGKAADEMVPQVYAAIAIALYRIHGFGYEEINRIFQESQMIWQSFADSGERMIDLCEKETGISLRSKNDE